MQTVQPAAISDTAPIWKDSWQRPAAAASSAGQMNTSRPRRTWKEDFDFWTSKTEIDRLNRKVNGI